MAKASRLSLGHNPNTAVANLRRNVLAVVSSRPASTFRTVAAFNGQLQILLSRLNSLAEKSSSSLDASIGFRRSNSAEAFFKGMIDQKLNNGHRRFIEELENIKTTFPVPHTKLLEVVSKLSEEISAQICQDLTSTDEEAGLAFSSFYVHKLKKVLAAAAESYVSLNKSMIRKEASVIVQSFLAKCELPQVRTLDQLNEEYFSSMRAYHLEFLKYFESQCKDHETCTSV